MKEIPLNHGYVALVDDADYELVSQFKWYANVCRDKNTVRVYASRRMIVDGVNVGQRIHRLLTGIKGVDHADRNTLNNQRYNLRPCNDSQNQANTPKKPGCSSRFKGVTFIKGNGKWQAAIKFKQKNHFLGHFRDEVDAAQAYNFKAYELFGEFARLNTPEGVL